MDKDQLKRILEQHRIWLYDTSNNGQRANLEEANLEGVNL